VVFAGALPGSAQADWQSDRAEQLRYAIETMNLHYPEYVDRANDFRAHGCWEWWLMTCTKPSPYNHFDWTTNGCSWTPPTALIVFNRPCQLHDFGYRNFGNGLTLERTESRRLWIDNRFRDEMYRICQDPRAFLPLGGPFRCRAMATAMYAVVRVRGGNPPWYPPVPVIVGVAGASGTVPTPTLWITVVFRDEDCDVTGGVWEGAAGSGLREEFGIGTARPDLMRGLVCNLGGIGSLQFARSCLWSGTWTEYMTLTDARGNRSTRFAFTFTCT
jgi:hypothetical protein